MIIDKIVAVKPLKGAFLLSKICYNPFYYLLINRWEHEPETIRYADLGETR